MPRNPSTGVYTLPTGNPVTSGTIITTTWANSTLQDIRDALSDSISASGLTKPSADIPFNSKKITGLADATALDHAVNGGQVLRAKINMLTAVSSDSSGNAYGGVSLFGGAPVDNDLYYFVADKTNTGAMTMKLNLGTTYPILVNGAAVTIGMVVAGTIVCMMFMSANFRIIGGVGSTGSGSVTSVTSTDPNVLIGTVGGGVLGLQPKTNVALGSLKLDGSAKVPIAFLPSTALNGVFRGVWDASGNTAPSNSANTNADYYVITKTGTISIYVASSGGNYTLQATVVNPGDSLVWNTAGSAAQPVGWYLVSRIVAAWTAAQTSMTATAHYATTDVQSWMNATDTPIFASMPKSGGIFTGQVYQGTPPDSASALTNRQYIADQLAAWNIGVASFNTRQGAVTLASGDITGALGYTPLPTANPIVTGDLTMSGGGRIKTVGSLYFNSEPVITPTSGAVSIAFGSFQKCSINLTGAATLTITFPGTGAYQLWLISNAFTPTITFAGVASSWLNSNSPPTYNTGPLGGILSMYYNGTYIAMSYASVGARI